MEINIPNLNETVEDIHERMLKKAPKDISILEGDIFWDTTRPTAEEVSRVKNMDMNYILKMAFPQTSYGKYLEYLGECKGIFKNPPTKSIGVIKVKGKQGTTIEKGKIAGTPATEEKESLEFEFIETKAIEESGFTTIKAKCLTTGSKGNVLANSITILITPINGVESVTNEEAFTGGTDLEDEEHYRERVLEEYKNEATSGNEEHYKKWAKEVEGVGNAYVKSEWNGPGTVKVLILDKNNKTANKELIDKVQNYIAPIVPKGQNRGGKAPLGAIVTVDTPTTLTVNIKAKFTIKEGFSLDVVLGSLKTKISNYLSTITIGGTIIYNAIQTIIGSFILTGEGIEDFANLTINEGTSNIKLTDQVAVIGEVTNIND